MLKSFTNVCSVCDTVHPLHPTMVTEAVFPKLSSVSEGIRLAVGVKITVAVALAPELRVPIVQLTIPPVALPQVPAVTVAEVNEAPAEGGKTSVKMILLARSPVLVMVYMKLTWLPTPTNGGELVPVMVKINVGPNLLRKASATPLR